MNVTETDTPRHLRGGTSWRLAARLARREVRRRPGRTVLVMLLVALPIFAMTVGSVLFRTGHDSHAERFHRTNGNADLASTTSAPGRIAASGAVKLLPEGSHTLLVHDAYVPVTAADTGRRSSYVRITDLPITDPIARGIVDVRAGRAPRDGEVLLSPSVADDFGVGVGSTLRLSRPDVTWTVSGIGRLTDEFGSDLIVAPGFDYSVFRPGYANERMLVEVPPGTDIGGLAVELAQRDTTFETADRPVNVEADDTVRPLAWGWVAGVVALAVMGIIITAAFATSARRQLVTIGQLSANGADQRLLRRTLSLQGSWSGLLGSLVGVGLAVATLTIFRATVESIIRHDPGPYVFSVADLAIIVLTGIAAATVAAFVPARTITRVPVLSALGGRRPLSTVPRRLISTGLLLFAGGVGLLVLVAAGSRGGTSSAGELFAIAAMLGGLGVLAGVCCISPVLVGGFGEISARLGGSGRLAARSLARVRTRSAAVVTAIATAGAVAVAIATFVGMDSDRDEPPMLPDDVVVLSRFDEVTTAAGGFQIRRPVSEATQETVEKIVPGIRFAPMRTATPPPPATTDGEIPENAAQELTIADPPVLDMLGLSDRDAAALTETGALEMYPTAWRDPKGGPNTFRTATGSFAAAIRQDDSDSHGGDIQMLMTPARVVELGFAVANNELIGIAPQALTDDQRDRLQQITNEAYADEAYFTDSNPTTVHEMASVASGEPVSATTVQLAIVAGALAFTLLVVAIGLALSAAESRDEHDVLVAVGARPRTLRRVAGLKATLLAIAGALLAVPAGFVPVTLAVRTATPDDIQVPPVVFPWLTAAMLLLAVPLIAGAATWLGSRIAQQVRPFQVSAIAVD